MCGFLARPNTLTFSGSLLTLRLLYADSPIETTLSLSAIPRRFATAPPPFAFLFAPFVFFSCCCCCCCTLNRFVVCEKQANKNTDETAQQQLLQKNIDKQNPEEIEANKTKKELVVALNVLKKMRSFRRQRRPTVSLWTIFTPHPLAPSVLHIFLIFPTNNVLTRTGRRSRSHSIFFTQFLSVPLRKQQKMCPTYEKKQKTETNERERVRAPFSPFRV